MRDKVTLWGEGGWCVSFVLATYPGPQRARCCTDVLRASPCSKSLLSGEARKRKL